MRGYPVIRREETDRRLSIVLSGRGGGGGQRQITWRRTITGLAGRGKDKPGPRGWKKCKKNGQKEARNDDHHLGVKNQQSRIFFLETSSFSKEQESPAQSADLPRSLFFRPEPRIAVPACRSHRGGRPEKFTPLDAINRSNASRFPKSGLPPTLRRESLRPRRRGFDRRVPLRALAKFSVIARKKALQSDGTARSKGVCECVRERQSLCHHHTSRFPIKPIKCIDVNVSWQPFK